MEGQASTTERERSHPLLWAIVDFRDAIDKLIEEQKAIVLGRGPEPIGAETPSIAVTPVPAPLPPTTVVPVAEPEPRPSRRVTPPESRQPWPRDKPPSPAPVTAAEQVATEPSRPEDARQRLDALAAKLLDRRMKQTAADPSARHVER